MKVVLAGAFGHLGCDILRVLVREGHEVVAIGREIRRPADCAEGYETRQIDVLKPESFHGVCNGADAVITTIGMTKPNAVLTNYDVDLRGNLNLLREAQRRPVRLIGAGIYNLSGEEGRQLTLDDLSEDARHLRERKLRAALDALQRRYGLDFAGHLEDIYHSGTLHRTAEYMRKHI